MISVAVRWYLRYGLSYRDIDELLAERGIRVDHVTVYRWVQKYTAEFIETARPCRRLSGNRWFVDETYVKVAGHWTYLYRAIDQHGQVVAIMLTVRRDLTAARAFFTRALVVGVRPVEVTTDRAPAYPRVLDEQLPAALQVVEHYANNPIEADHSRLKARLRPMRTTRLSSAGTVSAGHAFVQNLRSGHYELATEDPVHARVRVARRTTRPSHLTANTQWAHHAPDQSTQRSPSRRLSTSEPSKTSAKTSSSFVRSEGA